MNTIGLIVSHARRTCDIGRDGIRLLAARNVSIVRDPEARRPGCPSVHGAVRRLRFRRRGVSRRAPKGLQIHLIVDNYATHKHASVKAWLAKHTRFHLHFTPTSSSWLNLVERFFGKLTDKAIRRGVFHSVPDLIAAIEAYLKANNADPTPLVWTATADSILEKVRRGRVVLNTITSQN